MSTIETPVKSITTSKLFTVNWNDLVKGIVVAVGGAVFTVIENSIEEGNFNLNWTNIWHIGLAAFVAYIGKNFFTNPQTVVKGAKAGTIVAIPPPGTTVVSATDLTIPIGKKDPL